MSKPVFEMFGLKKEPVHPIVARISLYKLFDAKVEDAYGVWVTPINDDGTDDKNALRLYIPLGQLREVLSGKFADGFVQQYPSYNQSIKDSQAQKQPFKKAK